MLARTSVVGLSVVLGLACVQLARGAQVKVWEGTISIPTYLMGPQDPNPQFPLVNGHNIYPYTALDDLTDNRETKTYKAIYLENKYLKATILPQMDGRVYSLYDKANKREVFYRNRVIKYGMVGLRGAWITAGIEWNFPNGHTTDTVSPVASRYWQNPDGSATVVVGDVDQVSNMHWEVALTLHPDTAYLQAHVTLFNSTPVAKLYWWWANTAVPAKEDMQFIYPMRLANPHSHTLIWTYPIWKGVNYSWYKDVRHATSLFGVDVHRSFFGVYYHKLNYGVIHVANYHKVPGKKTWTWGVAGDGLIWTHLLTDNDGPYCEIQSGHFQTQLSQEFMPPQKLDSWNEYWYPVAGLDGGYVEGTPQMAINVIYPSSKETGKSVKVAVSPAARIRGAKVEVMLGAKTLKDFAPVSFEPLATRTFTIPVDDIATARKELRVVIQTAAGKTVLHWYAGAPIDGNPDLSVKPGVQEVNREPNRKLTTEQLFLRGLNNEKEGRSLEATRIYKEVLKRDPGYLPALMRLASQEYLGGDYASAEGLIVRAEARNRKDPEVGYLAGVIYKGAGKLGLAEDGFWRSIRFGGPEAPALLELGEIAIKQREYAKAAKLLRRALMYDPNDGVAMSDLAVALRLGGHAKEASKVVAEAVKKMPILPYALAEQWQQEAAPGSNTSAAQAAEVFKHAVGFRSQGYLEAGAWYRRLGDLAASDSILQAATTNLGANEVSPLIYYYQEANAWDAGKAEQAAAAERGALKAKVEAVFPARPQDADVLREVLAHNPSDAHAQYFLGNFLFAHSNYAEAADLWMKAAGEGFHYAVLYRNLGVYAWKVENDPAAAVTYYADAIRQSPDDFRLYVSLDEIYTQLGKTSAREKLLASAPASVQGHDTVRARRVLLNVEERRYDQALDALKGHNFKPWEGGQIIHQLYVLASLQKGQQAFVAGQFQAAEASFRAALEYPTHLGVGRPEYPQDEQAQYWLGKALEAQGKKSAAREAWQKAVKEMREAEGELDEGDGSSAQFYAALAMDSLGHADEAARILDKLAKGPEEGRTSAYDYYLAGLAENYRQQTGQAVAYFHHALKLDPDLWEARVQLQDEAGHLD